MPSPLALQTCHAPVPSTERGHRNSFHLHQNSFLFYCNGKNIFNRNLSTGKVTLSTEHSASAATLTVKCSPDGKFVASGDAQGLLVVCHFDEKTGEMLPYAKQRLWPGKINDICWEEPTGERLFVVGEGAAVWSLQKKACEVWGGISVHSRPVNSVCWHAVTGEAASCSDDFSIALFSGKSQLEFEKTLVGHSNFVQQVAYSPSGKHLASVSTDKRLIVHGVAKVAGAHDGGIYAVAWTAENTIVTVSADKKVKLWSVASGNSIELRGEILMQEALVGLSWCLEEKCGFVCGLSGALTKITLEKDSLSQEEMLFGHSSSVVQVGYCSASNETFSLDSNGILQVNHQFHSKVEGASKVEFYKKEPLVLVYGKLMRGKELLQSNVDAFCVKENSLFVLSQGKRMTFELSSLSLVSSHSCESNENSQVAALKDSLVVSCNSSLTLYKENEKITFNCEGPISALSLSPDNLLLAIGLKRGLVQIFSLTSFLPVITHEWSVHCGIVYTIEWLNNEILYSGSLDGCIVQWNVLNPLKWQIYRGAHAGGVYALGMLKQSSPANRILLISGGADACVKEWAISQE
jgi:WD40 repeat protein